MYGTVATVPYIVMAGPYRRDLTGLFIGWIGFVINCNCLFIEWIGLAIGYIGLSIK